MTAPSCPISTSQQKVTTVGAPPGVEIAHVATARDLRSVITALNQMSNIVQNITRGAPQINNTVFPSVNFRSTPPPREPPPQYQRVTWKEIMREYHDDEIVNPDNEDQKVEIKTIKRIRWQEDVTEQRVVYRGRL
jgi:hypothetical protein